MLSSIYYERNKTNGSKCIVTGCIESRLHTCAAGRIVTTNENDKNRSSNRAAVPEAKGALDKFKYEVASELGVPLTDGYNGDLTSKQNGSVGGYMVKKMIEQQEKQMAGK